ncbi:hypothetical protein [Methylomonas sp. AM2-LC]|uniref:hypothetical protein n=1 Tax=Methylomonas sp. AM2-LC TaxID=3153301 RepID=UPI00326359FC
MKKLLLGSLLLSSCLLSESNFAYENKHNSHSEDYAKVSSYKTSAAMEEQEVALWEELTIYAMIAGIYATYLLIQKE